MSSSSGRRGWRWTRGRTRRKSRGAVKRVADQLGVHPEALRNWVRHAEVDDGLRPGITTDDQTRITELEREVRELRRANEILKTSAAFFAAAELDRKIR